MTPTTLSLALVFELMDDCDFGLTEDVKNVCCIIDKFLLSVGANHKWGESCVTSIPAIRVCFDTPKERDWIFIYNPGSGSKVLGVYLPRGRVAHNTISFSSYDEMATFVQNLF